MPKLNLDIFGTDRGEPGADHPTKAKVSAQARHTETKPVVETAQLLQSARSPVSLPRTEPPKFIPVGFDQECLQLLDDAVLTLRRQGYWKASKSGIIRALIKLHRSDLVSVLPDQSLTTTSADQITERVLNSS